MTATRTPPSPGPQPPHAPSVGVPLPTPAEAALCRPLCLASLCFQRAPCHRVCPFTGWRTVGLSRFWLL